MKLVTDAIASLAPYEAGMALDELERRYGITSVIKLASNENAIGASPIGLAAARRALTEMADQHRYPDAAAFRLREKLAAFHGVGMEEIIHGSGSAELIDLAIRTFTTHDDHIVFAEPSFVAYRIAALSHGVPFTAVPTVDFVHDLEAMAKAITPKTRIVLVANPNNPTGTHVGRAALEKFLRDVPPEVIVLLDEAYLQYVDAPDFADGLGLRGLRERLVVLRTFSKIYGLASLRVGYAIGPANLIDFLNRVRLPFNVGSLGQVAAAAALDDHAHVEASRDLALRERTRVAAALRERGFTVAPSQTNFLFVDVKKQGRELFEALLREGVIIRPMGPTPFVRVTLGTEGENDRFLAALDTVSTRRA